MVLGFLRAAGPSTPYDLKRMHAISVGHFWSIPHSQLYAEPERLTKAGLVTEEREEGGRRRRRFTITPAGEAALDAWLAHPESPAPELRDVSLIKVFFGADPHAIAERQVAAHEQMLATYEELHAMLSLAPDSPRGPISTLDVGIRHERAMVDYWRSLLTPPRANGGTAGPAGP
jgi:PadR family transcriptional regulator, regulatory protein AphA